VAATNGNVIVVDDDQDACDLLAKSLSNLGYAVASFTSPAAALEHLSRELTDVVVSDISMAEMDGIELCEEPAKFSPRCQWCS